jgi:hypothetical protein
MYWHLYSVHNGVVLLAGPRPTPELWYLRQRLTLLQTHSPGLELSGACDAEVRSPSERTPRACRGPCEGVKTARRRSAGAGGEPVTTLRALPARVRGRACPSGRQRGHRHAGDRDRHWKGISMA